MKVDMENIRAARHKLATDGPTRVRSAGDFERVSIGKSDGDVLRDLMLAEKACKVIEIGLAYGGSALAIAEALVANGSGQEHHLIIDPIRIGSTAPDGAPSSKRASRIFVCCLRSDPRSFSLAF